VSAAVLNAVFQRGLLVLNVTRGVDCCCAAAMKDFVELFDSPQFNSYGSSLKLLMVAEGSAHVYPRCHYTSSYWFKHQRQWG
jgi:hypothetical protein